VLAQEAPDIRNINVAQCLGQQGTRPAAIALRRRLIQKRQNPLVRGLAGRADLLGPLFAGIDADMTANPASRVVQVLLGDYIDRGPQSREVLDLLVSRSQRHRMVCLKGNHETYIPGFLRDPATLDHWRQFGGLETLLSYGVTPIINANERERRELAEAFDADLPESHRRFLAGLKESVTCGDYFFAHAGVRPGVPLSQKHEDDLVWTREDFLLHEDGFGKIIVHGHTPVKEPDIRPNRINIDTGAYATGWLTCLVLEGEDMAFI
jgi:diadenosine tetraphosphatase ApaH/serine/threonine PP2A family protein phosphatase